MGAFRRIFSLRKWVLRIMDFFLQRVRRFCTQPLQKEAKISQNNSQNRRGLNFERILVFGAICLISGCAPSSLEDLRCQADAEMKGLLVELKGVETKEDLQKSAKKLKKYFQHIASLLVEARKFSNMESGISPVGEELFAEFARIYEIPGAREAVEQLQAEAVYVLRKKSYADPS